MDGTPEILEPGMYDSALAFGGELCLDAMRFTADTKGRRTMVHGAGETDPDGYRMRLTLWLGRDGLEGTWLHYATDGTSLHEGPAEFVFQDGRWCGVRKFKDGIGKEVAAEMWVLSLRERARSHAAAD